MIGKFELIMRDPRKAPYDVPLLVKTEEGYRIGKRAGRDWIACDPLGDWMYERSYDLDGEFLPVLITPLFYCELPST